MQQLIKLPEKISQSRAVIEFLEARPTDDPSYATAPDYSAPTSGAVANQPMNPAPRSAASLPSGGSGGGSGGGASRGALPPGPAAANTYPHKSRFLTHVLILLCHVGVLLLLRRRIAPRSRLRNRLAVAALVALPRLGLLRRRP